MSYAQQIESMKKIHLNLTEQFNAAVAEGKEDLARELSVKRVKVYEDIIQLYRKQWEEIHDTFHMDDY